MPVRRVVHAVFARPTAAATPSPRSHATCVLGGFLSASTDAAHVIGTSLRFPFQGDDWVRPFLLGSLCALTSFLVLPAIVLYGYTLRVIRAGATGQEELPAFDDWEGLLVDGIKAYAVVLVYTVPLTIVMSVLIFLVIGASAVGLSAAGSAGAEGIAAGLGVLTIVGFLAVFAVSLAVTYVIPASIVGLATQEDLSAAFDLTAIRNLVTSRTYLAGMLVITAVAIVGFTLAAPLIFLLVGFAVQFYLQVVIGHYLGQVARQAAADRQTGARVTGATA